MHFMIDHQYLHSHVINYKPNGPDPSNKLVAQEEKKEDSNAEYTKMELPCQGIYKKLTMHVR